MQDILIVNRKVNFAALSEQLSNLPSTQLVGMSMKDDDLILHFSDEANEHFIDQVQTLVADHDPDVLTSAQLEVLARQERLEQLREQNNALLDLANYTEGGTDILRLAEKVAWLELEFTTRH